MLVGSGCSIYWLGTRNSGRGNHRHGMGGFAFALGISVAPHFLTQTSCWSDAFHSGQASMDGTFEPGMTPEVYFQTLSWC